MIGRGEKMQALSLIADVINPQMKTSSNMNRHLELLSIATEIAVKNKIILSFYEKYLDLGINIPDSMHKVAATFKKRKEGQREAIGELLQISDALGIEFMVVKTLKPFNYVGDDIDLLVSNNHSLKLLINALRSHGYFIRKVGTPEIIVRKYILNVPIDLDIHHQLSAGYIPYISARDVWNKRIKKKIDGYEVYAPAPMHEMLITVGHSLLKELRMTLADFYHLLIVLKNLKLDDLYHEAAKHGLGNALRIFISVANRFHKYFYHEEVIVGINRECVKFIDIHDTIIRHRILKLKYDMPYVYPIELLFLAYADKFKHEVSERGFNAVLDFMRTPSAKGINLILDYLSKEYTYHDGLRR